ncbi:transmembrane protein, partial [Reticulomyxa filosa]
MLPGGVGGEHGRRGGIARVGGASKDVTTDYVVSVVNALVIMFFNNIYGVVAEKMNAWENYETETQYENNLILKVFVFRFVNSYASLYYLAFFRRFEHFDSRLHCDPEQCSKQLASQLAVIFLTQLFVSNAFELGTLWFARAYKRRRQRTAVGSLLQTYQNDYDNDDNDDNDDDDNDYAANNHVWNEYQSERYDRTFDDYNELLVSYGYCTLFVIAFPLAPLFGFLSNIVESRIDGYKLCRLQRRPFPRRADDIGAWQIALEVMAWAILATNLGLVCFASRKLRILFGIHNHDFAQVITVLCVFVLLVGLWQLLAWCFKDPPAFMVEHIHRTDHIEHQLQGLSREVEQFFDELKEDEVSSWEQWTVHYVLAFLKKVLVKNPFEFEPIKAIFLRHNINGKAFAKLKSDQLLKFGVKDYLIAELILHARALLVRHASNVKAQAIMFDELENQAAT